MDHFLWGLVIAVTGVLALFSAGHALLFKRDPRAAFGWIGICLTVPLVGPFLYWTMGVNRIHRRARQWLESGRRLTGWANFPERHGDDVSGHLPPALDHLSELSRLGNRVGNFPLLPGNRIAPLKNGENAYPEMLAAIAGASHSIHLSTYIFDGDATGRRFADALKSAAARGVAVRVLIDSLGEKYSRPTARRLLKDSQVKVGRFLPLSQGVYINLRNHRKLLIVDGCRAFTGGMNIGNRHVALGNAAAPAVGDLHFKVEGPVVADLQRVFLGDWHFVTGEILDDPRLFPPLQDTGTALTRAISDGPDKDFRKLHRIIMGALACSRHHVRIMTPYFIPDQPFISALVTTALRGVKVTLILPARNNLPYVHWATRAYLWELLQQGIRVLYQPPPFVHTKLLLVDGAWSLIGSANLDPRSLRLNFEFNLEVYDREFTALLEGDFDETAALSREITLEEMDGRALPEKLRDGLAKLFSPYL
ncbi:MAG TPA: cardiolipin synthase [Geobacteraceae bacterium]|nr:cardiolipin synthase [Geobacteraceae bacterium]